MLRRHTEMPKTPLLKPFENPILTQAPEAVVGKRVFARVKHDHEMFGVSRPELDAAPLATMGLPEIVRVPDPVWVPLPRAWQWYWYDLIYQSAMGAGAPDNSSTRAQIVELFRKITRSDGFKTAGHGSDKGYLNFVTNEGGKEPIATEVLVTGGAYLEILEYPRTFKVRGKECYKFRTLDAKYAPPAITEFTPGQQNWYAFFATTSRRIKLPNGGREVIPLTGGVDIPTPNISPGGFNYLLRERVEILGENAPVPSPYSRQAAG